MSAPLPDPLDRSAWSPEETDYEVRVYMADAIGRLSFARLRYSSAGCCREAAARFLRQARRMVWADSHCGSGNAPAFLSLWRAARAHYGV